MGLPRRTNRAKSPITANMCVRLRVERASRSSFPDGDDVAFAQLVEHSVQLRPVTISAGDLFAEELGASGLLESVELKSQPLIFSRDPRVAYLHPKRSPNPLPFLAG